jgi:hypothetical protein
MDASSWIIILVLTCSPFIAFGCVSFTILCCDCNQDGHIVVLKSGWGVRKHLIEDSIVTKVSGCELLFYRKKKEETLRIRIGLFSIISHTPQL